jgi:hypothetical protein
MPVPAMLRWVACSNRWLPDTSPKSQPSPYSRIRLPSTPSR